MASTPSFRNWKLAWNVNLVYHRLVNVDIARPPYADHLQPLSFFLKKRNGYKDIGWWGERETTDVFKETSDWCKEGDGAYYFYQVSPDRLRYRILKLPFVWGSLVCTFETIDEGCRCYCGEDRFTSFDYVKWEPKLSSTTWVQWNSQNIWPRFYDENQSLQAAWINTWDYILAYSSRNREWDGFCGQVRSVVGIGSTWASESDSQYTDYVDVNVGRQWFGAEQEFWPWVSYKVFPERGRVFAYHTCDGIKVWHSDDEQTVMCDFGKNLKRKRECITSIREHNWTLTFMNETGSNFFWGSALDLFYVTSDNVNFIGSDIISTDSYRNFLLFFGNDSISTVVYEKTWQVGFSYKLREDIGIWSKTASVQFENSLYFMWSDKRIYATNISSDWDNFQMQLEDISARIKWHLELLKEWDEVWLSSDGRRMYVFITWKWSPGDSNNTKTKILIRDRDYDVWLEHRVCCAKILHKKHGFYLWSSLFDYCWYEDCSDATYSAQIEAFIADNDNQQTDGRSNPSDLFRRKKLNWAKVLLGKWQYTDDNTFFLVETYRNGYKLEKQYVWIEGNEWIDNWNKYFSWDVVPATSCMLDDLEECSYISRKCDWSSWTDELSEIGEETWCWCPPDPIDADDYCVCIDSRAYALQPFYNMFLDMRDNKRGDLHKITIHSQGLDTLYFWGMVVSYDSLEIDEKDWEWFDFLWTQCCENKSICKSSC